MLTVMDWFCGAGGSSQGADLVPGVEVTKAANHWDKAIASHEANFPRTDHHLGDIRKANVFRWPVTDIFLSSPECPKWSGASGVWQDFKTSMQPDLFGELVPSEEVQRSRALMEEVPQYLRGVRERGGLIKAGVVENVTDVRSWDQWGRWIREIRAEGYHTRLIAINSMHVIGPRSRRAPQSRDRLYLAYWHESLGRHPDWDKWLRPLAWCPGCDTWVRAMQVFKQPGRDMGSYNSQYVYRCPSKECRSSIVSPEVLPAAACIDWTLPGNRIGDRKTPLADKTMARIRAGLTKFAQPLVVPAGGTWRNDATSVSAPMPTRTTVETDALAIPPLMIPVEGRDGKEASSANGPLRTQTARAETALAWLPFIAELRGGGSEKKARPVSDPLCAVTASGNHHGLVTPADLPAMVMRNNGSKGDGGEHCTLASEPLRTLTAAGHQSLVSWEHLLIPYYGNGQARTVSEPIGTLSTHDRYALVEGAIDVDDVLFRMLQPHEIGAAMAFGHDYTVLGNKRQKVRQYGNAVTPNVMEVIVSALVEAITGEELDRDPVGSSSLAQSLTQAA